MAEVDLLQEIQNAEAEKIQYKARFDPDSFKIVKVGPSISFNDDVNIVDLDEELAERILNGEIKIHNCYLDIDSGGVDIVETQSLTKIDDVLHRIPSKKWCEHEDADVFVCHNTVTSSLKIQLGKQWGGNYVDLESTNQPKSRKIHWSGDTEMDFLVTEYNDPNIIFDKFSFNIIDLVNGDMEFQITVPHDNISLYTRRLFKKYVMDFV